MILELTRGKWFRTYIHFLRNILLLRIQTLNLLVEGDRVVGVREGSLASVVLDGCGLDKTRCGFVVSEEVLGGIVTGDVDGLPVERRVVG